MNDQPWDDARLSAAYRALAAKPAPADLLDSTLAASANGTDREPFRPTFLRPRAVLAGAGFGLALVVVLMSGLLLLGRSAPAGTSAPTGLPGTVDGLTVMTVSQALAAEPTAGNTQIALGGWYAPHFPFSCPVPSAMPAELEDACTNGGLLITENRQTIVHVEATNGYTQMSVTDPSGPNLKAYEVSTSGTAIPYPVHPEATGDAEYAPVQVILIGHFHDARAAKCSPEQRAHCEAAFVIDRLARYDGKATATATDVQGPYRLTFQMPSTEWHTTDAISATATLEFTGTGSVDYGSSGSGPFAFAFEEIGGSRQMGWSMTTDCLTQHLDAGAPISSGIIKTVSWTDPDPNADFYRSFYADPLVHLPAGDWKITAVARFVEGAGCSGQSYTLNAPITIHVSP